MQTRVMAQILFIFSTVLVLLMIVGLFLRKADLQLHYLREQSGKKWQRGDFLRFSWQDSKARQERWQAFTLFPMLIPITLDDQKESLLTIKKKIKRVHIWIYLVMVLLVVMGIYSEKI